MKCHGHRCFIGEPSIPSQACKAVAILGGPKQIVCVCVPFGFPLKPKRSTLKKTRATRLCCAALNVCNLTLWHRRKVPRAMATVRVRWFARICVKANMRMPCLRGCLFQGIPCRRFTHHMVHLQGEGSRTKGILEGWQSSSSSAPF